MKVIAFQNQKGGTGKTTLAVNVAYQLHTMGFRIQLVDLDKGQESATTWSKLNGGKYFDVCLKDINEIRNHLARDPVSADYYILDCPPKAEIVETEIMKVSDIVLIPFSPSPLDIWATRNLVEAIEARKSVTSSPSYPSGTPDAAFLLSGATKGTRLVQECIAELAKTKLEVMTGHTTVFTAYPRCFIDGETVFTAKEQNKEAQQQIIDITNEILERIKDDE